MTEEQRAQAVELLPVVRRCARRYGPDDEHEGVAALALCEALERWRPEWGVSPKTYVWREANKAVARALARARRLVPADLDALPGRQPEPLLHRLPERLHQVFRLRYLDGLAPWSVAKRIGATLRRTEEMLNELERYLRT